MATCTTVECGPRYHWQAATIERPYVTPLNDVGCVCSGIGSRRSVVRFSVSAVPGQRGHDGVVAVGASGTSPTVMSKPEVPTVRTRCGSRARKPRKRVQP